MSYDERAYGFLNVAPAVTLRICVRCGAVVGDAEKHDRWHGAMDK